MVKMVKELQKGGTGKPLDRRVKYTIAALKGALVVELQQKHISKVSVKALCERADVNRSTFYAHFTDQYDLLGHMEQEVMDNIVAYLDDQQINRSLPVSEQVLKRILDYVQADADMFRALLGDNCELDIQHKIIELAQLFPISKSIKQVREEFSQTQEAMARSMDYLIIYGTTGCISIIRKWLQDGMPESTGEISALIMATLQHGLEELSATLR